MEKCTTWVPVIASPNSTDIFGTELKRKFGYPSNRKYGYEAVALGWARGRGQSLDHHIVVGMAIKDF